MISSFCSNEILKYLFYFLDFHVPSILSRYLNEFSVKLDILSNYAKCLFVYMGCTISAGCIIPKMYAQVGCTNGRGVLLAIGILIETLRYINLFYTVKCKLYNRL